MRRSKLISYKIFTLLYGKILGIKKVSKVSSTITKKFYYKNKKFKNIYILKNCRLYTDRIHNLALLHNNYLLDGPSYQIHRDNYSNIKKNIVLKIGTPRILKKLSGSLLSLLSGGGANTNYFHWLYDVLPRLNIIKKFISLKKINYFLLPSLEKNFQKETLRLIGLKKKQLLSSVDYRHLSCDQIYVTDHPYIQKKSLEEQLDIPLWILKWLRKTFLSKINTKRKNKYLKKIYIERGFNVKENAFNSRILKNERLIKNFLKAEGFHFINPENYTFLNQVKLYHNAKVILGVHGSGFANIVFCKKNTKIIELQTKDTGDVIKNLSLRNNLIYFRLKSKSTMSFNQNGIIDIDFNALNKIVKNL